MADRNDADTLNGGASRITPGLRMTPSSEQVTHALQSIVDEVESRGPDGHWLSRSSVTVANARIALQNAAFDKERLDPQRQEAALRDLVWRAEHVRGVLAAGAAGPETQEISALLDTSEARAALGLGDGGGIGQDPDADHTRRGAEKR